MKREIKRALASLCLLSFASVASAMTTADNAFICPIGGEQFQQTMSSSGTVRGTYLDLRPYGAIEAPWPLPQCPGNGFVMFKRNFSLQELDKLAVAIESNDYVRSRQTETPYFLVAHLLAAIGADHRQQAYALLKASWQGNDEQAPRYRALVIEHLDQHKEPPSKPELAVVDQLVAGEMERRLGRFDAARRRFEAVKRSAAPRSEQLDRIIALQVQLIEAKDTQDHKAPAEESTSAKPRQEPSSPKK
ncbi:hypothetical protein [Roseateles flavus]|uniref:Tetratricopeptide repeat protein n=1 Tax=Roseateles flavus TaxID=3149041 RepID=A0ABV0GIR1_9BURK